MNEIAILETDREIYIAEDIADDCELTITAETKLAWEEKRKRLGGVFVIDEHQQKAIAERKATGWAKKEDTANFLMEVAAYRKMGSSIQAAFKQAFHAQMMRVDPVRYQKLLKEEEEKRLAYIKANPQQSSNMAPVEGMFEKSPIKLSKAQKKSLWLSKQENNEDIN